MFSNLYCLQVKLNKVTEVNVIHFLHCTINSSKALNFFLDFCNIQGFDRMHTESNRVCFMSDVHDSLRFESPYYSKDCMSLL